MTDFTPRRKTGVATFSDGTSLRAPRSTARVACSLTLESKGERFRVVGFGVSEESAARGAFAVAANYSGVTFNDDDVEFAPVVVA